MLYDPAAGSPLLSRFAHAPAIGSALVGDETVVMMPRFVTPDEEQDRLESLSQTNGRGQIDQVLMLAPERAAYRAAPGLVFNGASIPRAIRRLTLRAVGVLGPANQRKLELTWRLFRTRSLPAFGRALVARCFPTLAYRWWILRHEPTPAGLRRQRVTTFPFQPRFRLAVFADQTPSNRLLPLLNSVHNQTYGGWLLDLFHHGQLNLPAPWKEEGDRLRFHPSAPGRTDGDWFETLVAGTEEYVGFVDGEGELAPFTCFEIVRKLNEQPDADFLYADKDTVGPTGRRRDPDFKPDWSPDLLRSHNYIGHFFLLRRDLFERIAHSIPGDESPCFYDLILRATEQARRMVHIPRILFHRRPPTAARTDVREEARAKRALVDHLTRTGQVGTVQAGPLSGTFRVSYSLPAQPLVSIIIPNRDNARLLDRCLKSVLRSDYPRIEVLVVENNSREPETFRYYEKIRNLSAVRVLDWEKAFNYSAVNNFAVSAARGHVLLFLNNDVEALRPDWLRRLLEHALRPDVGAVGAKMYYPDDTIQHGGIILGVGGIAGHAHHLVRRGAPGYGRRLLVAQNLSAVTAACLMTRAELFRNVGGFDEQFELAFNDVDLCLRMRKNGYRIVWTPAAELYHHESLSRGRDDTPEKQARFGREVDRFKERWGQLLHAGDPYYNPNLSLDWEDFRIRI